MKSQVTIYKGVKLLNGRTKEMIDTIIEKRDSLTTEELAELVGLPSWRSLIGIFRSLNHIEKVFKPVKTPNNTYKNYHGTSKAKARQLVAEAIMLTKRQKSNILTLPADQWLMEKNILKQKNGYKFTAVERNKETYQNMVKNLILDENLFNSVIGMENKTIGEVTINDVEDTYSSAILDYCGFIDTFYNEINDILNRNIVRKGGFIAITLSENDRAINNPKQMGNYTNNYIENCCVGEEVNGEKVTTDLVRILVHNNKDYKIVEKFNYCDNRANMLLFIIKRND